MPKFSLGVLLWTVGLFAAGFGLVAIGIRGIGSLQALGVFFSIPFIGAGIGALRQRKRDGFLWGAVVAILLTVAALLPANQMARE